MLKPSEIDKKEFKKGIGYSKKDVNDFMTTVYESYEMLYNENINLKDKITILNDGLQYYKSIEKTLQKALVLAQKTADENHAEALKKANVIEIQARQKADNIVRDARNELRDIRLRASELIMRFDAYRSQIKAFAQSQIELIENESSNLFLDEIRKSINEDTENAKMEAEMVGEEVENDDFFDTELEEVEEIEDEEEILDDGPIHSFLREAGGADKHDYAFQKEEAEEPVKTENFEERKPSFHEDFFKQEEKVLTPEEEEIRKRELDKLKTIENLFSIEEQAKQKEILRKEALKEQAEKEKALQEKKREEQFLKEQAMKEQILKEQAMKEQALKEQAMKEQILKEQAMKEQALKEQVKKQEMPEESPKESETQEIKRVTSTNVSIDDLFIKNVEPDDASSISDSRGFLKNPKKQENIFMDDFSGLEPIDLTDRK